MALPSYFYSQDPSNHVDALREAERKMSGCDKCANQITMVGLTGCIVGGRVDEDNYCRKWVRRAK